MGALNFDTKGTSGSRKLIAIIWAELKDTPMMSRAQDHHWYGNESPRTEKQLDDLLMRRGFPAPRDHHGRKETEDGETQAPTSKKAP